MLNTCVHCKGIFYGPNAERLISEKYGVRYYQQNCQSCGAKFRVRVEEISSPTLDGKALEDISNVVRDDPKRR
jgi:hypothetical protein